MADTFPIWQRQVMPEGRVILPQAGPSLIESFGSGGKELLEAGFDVADALMSRGKKAGEKSKPDDAAWLGEQIAAAKFDLARDHAAALDRPAEPETLPQRTAGRIEAEIARRAKAAPSPDAGARLGHALRGFKADLVADALGVAASAKVADRAAALDRAVAWAGRTAAALPDQLPALQQDVARAIEGQTIAPAQKAALLRQSQRAVAETYLEARLGSDPEAALSELAGDKLAPWLDTETRAAWRQEAERRRDAALADEAVQQQRAERDAAEALHTRGAEAATRLFDAAAEGSLKADDIAAARDLMPPAQHAALTAMLRARPAGGGGRAAATLLRVAADRDLAPEAAAAVARGDLESAAFRRLLAINRRLMTGDTPYRAARRQVIDALTAPRTLPARQARVAAANLDAAVNTLDDWAASRGDASTEDFELAVASILTEAGRRSRQSLGAPADAPALAAAERQALQRYDAGAWNKRRLQHALGAIAAQRWALRIGEDA
jgi:hypothetical protein